MEAGGARGLSPEVAVTRIVHRIIMVVLLAAVLAIIWNVLGGR
jgi:hypothetical protein